MTMSLNDALLKSKKSLDAAQRALNRMHSSTRLVEIEDQWEAVLYALAQVVKTLAPLKTEPSLTEILKMMELDRRSGDPLVTYVYEARNSKDHGLKPVTAHQPASTVIGSTSGELSIGYARIGGTVFQNVRISGTRNAIVINGPGADRAAIDIGKAHDPSGRGQVFVERTSEHVSLMAVSNERNKRIYPVPTTHKGNSISSSVADVATLALKYYQERYREILEALDLNSHSDYSP